MNTNSFKKQANQALLTYLMTNMSIKELNQQIREFSNETTREMLKHQGELLFNDAYKYLKLLKIQKDLQKIKRKKNAKNSAFCLKLVS